MARRAGATDAAAVSTAAEMRMKPNTAHGLFDDVAVLRVLALAPVELRASAGEVRTGAPYALGAGSSGGCRGIILERYAGTPRANDDAAP